MNMNAQQSASSLEIRIHGGTDLPTLVYLPGIHGDWTLVGAFRSALEGKVRFVEFAYPVPTTWSLREYASAVALGLRNNLAGLIDPVVPWPLVNRCFRQNCASFHEAKVILKADHIVLGTAPEASALQVLKWMHTTDFKGVRAIKPTP
jgi:hypothetical protein